MRGALFERELDNCYKPHFPFNEGNQLDVYEAIRMRVAVHEFKDRPVPKELLTKVLRAGGMAPSPENYQPWEFVIIQDKVVRKKLTQLKLESRSQVLKEWYPNITEQELERKLQRNRTAMETAPVLVAVAYKNLDSLAETGEQKVSLSLIAAWTSISYMWLAATSEGLGLSPTFYSHAFYEQAKSTVGLPQGYELAAVLRIGYPLKKPLGRKKTLVLLESKIHEDHL